MSASEVWQPLDSTGAPLPSYFFSRYSAAYIYVMGVAVAARALERAQLHDAAVQLLRALTYIQTPRERKAALAVAGARMPLKPPPCGVENFIGEWCLRLAIDMKALKALDEVVDACNAALAAEPYIEAGMMADLRARHAAAILDLACGSEDGRSPAADRTDKVSHIYLAARRVAGAPPPPPPMEEEVVDVEDEGEDAATAALVLGHVAKRKVYAGALGAVTVEQLGADYFTTIKVHRVWECVRWGGLFVFVVVWWWFCVGGGGGGYRGLWLSSCWSCDCAGFALKRLWETAHCGVVCSPSLVD